MKLFRLSIIFITAITANTAFAEESIPSITLYKDKDCGCCESYVNYLQNEGLDVTAINHPKMSEIKYQYGTYNAPSCHTMVIGDYVIEGHVPIASIERLWDEKPDIKGIALPGMPSSSPGMGDAVKDSLTIMEIDHNNGVQKVFNKE